MRWQNNSSCLPLPNALAERIPGAISAGRRHNPAQRKPAHLKVRRSSERDSVPDQPNETTDVFGKDIHRDSADFTPEDHHPV